METTVRIANQADISAIFDIRTSVTENHLSHDQLSEMGITPQAIREAIQASPCVWVAEVEGVLSGFPWLTLKMAACLPRLSGLGSRGAD